jgi:hypothetical protein
MGEATVRNFLDAETGGCFEHTPDPNAAGAFTRRQQPFVHNVTCARFFAALGWRDRAQRVLAAIATPRNLDDQGRMVGEFLLALDESGAYLW